MTDMTKLESELDYYKRALASANRELEKRPKGSFVALTVRSRGPKSGWRSECAIYIDDNDSVRKNNELKHLYDVLCSSLGLEPGAVSYREEGVKKTPGE